MDWLKVLACVVAVCLAQDTPECETVVACDDDADDCFRIGFSWPSVGDQSVEGHDMKHGYMFWATNANRDGIGMGDDVGPQIELVACDDQNDPDIAHDIYEDFVNGGDNGDFDFLFGPFGTSFTDQALDVTRTSGRALLFANSAAESTFSECVDPVDCSRQFGLMTTGAHFTQTALAELGNEVHHARTAGVLRQVAEFTGSFYQGALLHMFENNIILVADEVIRGPVGDLTMQLQRIREKDPDILMVFPFQTGAINITMQVWDNDLKPRAFFMTSAPSMPFFVDPDKLDPNLSLDILGPTQWFNTLDFADEFFDDGPDFSAKFNVFCNNLTLVPDCDTEFSDAPSDNVAGPAATGYVLQMALEALLADTVEITEDEIVDRLHTMFVEPVPTFYGPVMFDAFGHNLAHEVVVTQVREGDTDPSTNRIAVVIPDEHNDGLEVDYPMQLP